MGQSFDFECAQCGYQAHVTGGSDRGFTIFITTISCEECRALYDVVTAEVTVDKETWEKTGVDKKPIHCPKSANHKVKPWERGGPCPKCGKPMAKGRMGRLWD